jgi:hypothetical protein
MTFLLTFMQLRKFVHLAFLAADVKYVTVMENQPMDDEESRSFRHELRGRWHALRLCIDALHTCTERKDILEFLDAIVVASDEMDQTLQKIAKH